VEIIFLERERAAVSVMYPRTVPVRIFLQEPHLGSNESRWSSGDTALKLAVHIVIPVISLFQIFFIIFGNAKLYYVGMTVINKSISLVVYEYISVTNTPGLICKK
jgi:hypothetical protein